MLLRILVALFCIAASSPAADNNYLFPELFSFEPVNQMPAGSKLLPNRVYRVSIKGDPIKRFALTDTEGNFPTPFKILFRGSTIPGFYLGAKQYDQHFRLSSEGVWLPKDEDEIHIFEIFSTPRLLQAIYYPIEKNKKFAPEKKPRLISSAIPEKVKKAHYKICTFETSHCTTEAVPPLKPNALYLVSYEGEKESSLQLTNDYGVFLSPDEWLMKDSLFPGTWIGDQTPRAMYQVVANNEWIKSAERLEKQTFQIQSTPPRLKIISYTTQFGKR